MNHRSPGVRTTKADYRPKLSMYLAYNLAYLAWWRSCLLFCRCPFSSACLWAQFCVMGGRTPKSEKEDVREDLTSWGRVFCSSWEVRSLVCGRWVRRWGRHALYLRIGWAHPDLGRRSASFLFSGFLLLGRSTKSVCLSRTLCQVCWQFQGWCLRPWF